MNKSIKELVINKIKLEDIREVDASQITNDEYKKRCKISNEFIKRKQKEYKEAEIRAENVVLY